VKAVALVPPLAIASVPPRVIVPDEVIGPPVVVNPVEPPEIPTDVTVPEPPPAPTHTPAIEKHPLAISRPLVKVEVAPPVTVREARVANPRFELVAKRLVDDAVVVKREVVVALSAVKFWSVVEPATKRSPLELNVEVAVPPK
jgi:hypothetical protein